MTGVNKFDLSAFPN